jgi:DNA-binding response OmpR family regulator
MPTTHQILIVDDDPELRDALTEQLSLHEEFEAVAAVDGSKGLQAAKVGQIDLVIMDVGLPDIDGREAVRTLRKNCRHRRPRSGADLAQERLQGADHHAHGP